MSTSPLEYTPLSEIPVRVEKLRSSFHTRKFDAVEARINALRQLYFLLKDNEDLIVKALKKDLNKPEVDVHLLELAPVYSDLLYAIGHLSEWVKGKKPPDVPMLFMFSNTHIDYVPLGTVLIIGAYNYPVLLTIQPLIGAIAAGNTVVIKQSEQVPHTSATLTEILSDGMDNELIQFINGGIEETTAVLDQKFDKVMYTGSGNVGKIIATKCAQTLTPCILELGGKSPAFITKHCKNLDIAARRIAYVAFCNAGQICVRVDYALVDRDIYDEFVGLLKKWTIKMFGEVTPDTYTKTVNERNATRVLESIQNTKGEIVYGGDSNVAERFIQPTIVSNVTFSDSLMKEENFGPVLPVIPFDDIDDAITDVVKQHDTPLALYAFTANKKEINAIKTRIRSGAFCVDEAMIHVGMAQIPFGGVGNSGNGNYHGYNSFKAFSHERAILRQPYWVEKLFKAKYPPVSAFDLKLALTFMVPPAWFGRTGPIRNWRKIARNTAISAFLATGIYLGFNSEKDEKFFTL